MGVLFEYILSAIRKMLSQAINDKVALLMTAPSSSSPPKVRYNCKLWMLLNFGPKVSCSFPVAVEKLSLKDFFGPKKNQAGRFIR